MANPKCTASMPPIDRPHTPVSFLSDDTAKFSRIYGSRSCKNSCSNMVNAPIFSGPSVFDDTPSFGTTLGITATNGATSPL